MASFHTHFLIILFVLSSFTIFTLGSLQALLEIYGLPLGIFPENVIGYDLDENSVLKVQLDKPCLTKFETLVYYESVVRANLSEGKLWGMEGLSNKELFIWLPVKGIIANYPNTGLVLVDITMANKTLSLSLFDRPPKCQPEELTKCPPPPKCQCQPEEPPKCQPEGPHKCQSQGQVSSQVLSVPKKGGNKHEKLGFGFQKIKEAVLSFLDNYLLSL